MEKKLILVCIETFFARKKYFSLNFLIKKIFFICGKRVSIHNFFNKIEIINLNLDVHKVSNM